jgi:hypothetical protein
MVKVKKTITNSNDFTMKIESMIYDFHGKINGKNLSPADNR